MDAQQFLAEFGHIANAPGGVSKLRELILHLAVSGKLTVQGVGEDAGDLLDEIKARQSSLQSDGTIRVNRKIRSEKSLGGWQIPPNWLWCRFGELCSFSAGKTPSRKEVKYWKSGGYPWFSIADMSHGQVVTSSSETVSEDARAEVFKSEPSPVGSLLMSFKLSIGKLSLLGVPAYHNEAIITIEPFAPELKEYFFKCLNGFDLSAGNKAAIKGNTLNQDSLSNIFVALPPKNEIFRIVAKVDELMALCDKLEAQQQARRNLQNALRQSTLQAVASSQSPHELQATWARLTDNFGRLFHAPEDVAEIKSLILDLAIQGLLADRQLDDEPAETLISRSLEAKRVRLASGEMKNKKPSAADIVDVEINIPAHWKRASLDELFQFIDYRGKTPTKTSSGVVLVTAKNVRPGFIANEPVEFLSESSYQAWMTRGFPRIGDLLITTEAPLGNVARIEEQPSFALAQRVIDLQPFADLNTKCAMYFIMSPLFQSLLEENSTGMTAKGIKAGKLKQLLLPIPPIEEQQRIVQGVEELINICSVLSSQLEAVRKQSARLAVAAVSSFTGITIEEEDEPMKTPQTELIAPLRLGTEPDIKAQAPLTTILARHYGEMSAKDLWQRFGGEIDAFYAQLKTEVAHGWILEPAPAEMREKPADAVSA